MLNLYVDGAKGSFESLTFPGGEEHVRITCDIKDSDEVIIEALPRTSGDLMQMLLLKNAVDHVSKAKVSLDLLYLPYARQDRVCSPGDAFSLEVVAGMINSADFSTVTLFDPHSRVSVDSIKRSFVTTQLECVESLNQLNFELYECAADGVVVAPDSGALKKSESIAKAFDMPLYEGIKERDPATGKLTGFGVDADLEDIQGKDVFIFDDICDGGGTFIGLIQEIKKLSPNSITLYITHGIFSNPENTLTLHDELNALYVFNDWNNL